MSYRIVRIGAAGDMKLLATYQDVELSQAFIEGYKAGGGLTRKGLSEHAPELEVWEVAEHTVSQPPARRAGRPRKGLETPVSTSDDQNVSPEDVRNE